VSSSRIFAALNAQLSIIQSVFASTAVVVYDGPQPEIPSDQDFWVVGSDNVLSDGMSQSVTGGNQDWISMARMTLTNRSRSLSSQRM
jgi:hypothetical protein